MVSRECQHTSESEDPFYMVPLVVPNKKNLHQALTAYIDVCHRVSMLARHVHLSS